MCGWQQHVFHGEVADTRKKPAQTSATPAVNALTPAKLLTPRQALDGAILPG
jgi:hypothetical protein